MESTLNHLLADLVVEYHKLQSFHWYVKGEDFFQAHVKIEELYDDVNDFVDQVAEVILQIGAQPISSMRQFLDTSSIEEREDSYVSSKDAYASIIEDFQGILDEAVSIKGVADGENAYLVSTTMDDLIVSLSKTLWMLRQGR